MSCSGSDYGTHRCVRCDSEVDDVEAYARGVADERARVVADLRAWAATQKSWTGESAVAAVLRAEADRLEREAT